MVLKGYKQTRALRVARLAVWAIVGVLGLMVACQLRTLVRAPEHPAPPARPATAFSSEAAPGETDLPPLKEFAVIWQKMDPEPPKPEPTATQAVELEPSKPPAPPPDPYPDMRLLGTITEHEQNYALIQIGGGTTKLLREGVAFGDIRVLTVAENEATVELPGRTKALRIKRKPGANVTNQTVESSMQR